MHNIEIIVVKNGYMLRESGGSVRDLLPYGEVRVFETFEALTAFLQASLAKPKESK